MDTLPRERMTSDTFLAWAMEQPEGRYELMDGVVFPMAPNRQIVIHHHRRVEGDILTRLVGTGAIRLAPPGINLDVAPLFP